MSGCGSLVVTDSPRRSQVQPTPIDQTSTPSTASTPSVLEPAVQWSDASCGQDFAGLSGQLWMSDRYSDTASGGCLMFVCSFGTLRVFFSQPVNSRAQCLFNGELTSLEQSENGWRAVASTIPGIPADNCDLEVERAGTQVHVRPLRPGCQLPACGEHGIAMTHSFTSYEQFASNDDLAAFDCPDWPMDFRPSAVPVPFDSAERYPRHFYDPTEP